MDGRRRAGNPIRPSGTVRSRLALAALASCLFIGCAWVETRQDDLDPSEPRGFDFHDKSRGIRYYEAAVFLLVHTDNKGSIVVKHMVLPDTTRKMSAEPHEILASTKATLTFSGGVLATTSETTAADVVPKAVLDAAKTVAAAAVQAGAAGARAEAKVPPKAWAPGIYLFRLRAVPPAGEETEWRYSLTGAQGSEIQVPAPPPAEGP